MKNLRNLFIALTISTLLAANTLAGDMHSDSKKSAPPPPPPPTSQLMPPVTDEEVSDDVTLIEAFEAILAFLPFL